VRHRDMKTVPVEYHIVPIRRAPGTRMNPAYSRRIGALAPRFVVPVERSIGNAQ